MLKEGNALFGEDGQDSVEAEKKGIRMSNMCDRVRTG